MPPDPLAGQTVLCLLPHPDDEFAIFAEIEASLESGCRVLCVYLTDGGYGGQSPERREAESRKVLGALGVAARDVHFLGSALGIGDRTLHRRTQDALSALRQLVGHGGAPALILVPAWEGGHPDHDAAHLVGLALQNEPTGAATILQYPVYHGHGTRGSFFKVLSPLPANGPVIERPIPWSRRFAHLRYCLSYPSQLRTWLALFPFVLLHYVVAGRQRVQRVDAARIVQRPHLGALLYERRCFCTWSEFTERTQELRDSITDRTSGSSLRPAPGSLL